jgi:UDP-N-acetylglucosamine 2-epimerase
MMDVFFCFGQHYADQFTRVGSVIGRSIPVGSPILNEKFDLIRSAWAEDIDILMIDQTTRSLRRHSKAAYDSLVKLLENLAAFMKAHHKTAVRYQLRDYEDKSEREETVALLERFKISWLDNTGHYESYENMARSQLVLTMWSTMGYEALAIGKKVLFCNYTGDPALSVAAVPEIQEIDPSYASFERKIKDLLARPIPAEVKREAALRQRYFDGNASGRIAQTIKKYLDQ